MTQNQSSFPLSEVISYVRLPLLLVLIYAIARFTLGLAGVPYAPRGNSMFSVLGVTIVSCIYFGAMSRRIGGFGWLGTVLVGVVIGLFSQILIFAATWASFAFNLNTYYVHWDALNVEEGTSVAMSTALATRAGGLIAGPILGLVAASVGRLLGFLAPEPKQ